MSFGQSTRWHDFNEEQGVISGALDFSFWSLLILSVRCKLEERFHIVFMTSEHLALCRYNYRQFSGRIAPAMLLNNLPRLDAPFWLTCFGVCSFNFMPREISCVCDHDTTLIRK